MPDQMPSHSQPKIYGRSEAAYWGNASVTVPRCPVCGRSLVERDPQTGEVYEAQCCVELGEVDS